MKHIQFVLFILFLFYLPGLKAQQNHFIYIQTENKQPFYVKLEQKLYSSSSSGYLVVPKLKEGGYNLVIGFPKGEYAEQQMLCTINKNDLGYLLKNFEEKGWGLFNFQTLDVVMASNGGEAKNIEVVTQTDAFSNMLSNVVNDSTIRQSEVVKEIKKEPVKEAEKADEKAAVPTPVPDAAPKVEVKPMEENKSAVATGEVAASGTATRSAITRSLFNKNTAGTEMVFIDEANGKKDTVTVFIPAGKNAVQVNEKPGEESKPEAVKQEAKTSDNKFLEIELPNPNNKPEEKKAIENEDSNKVGSGKSAEPVTQKAAMINSDCKTFASDEDFLKLRKKMAAEDNDEEMITIAKKLFKAKCFTVEQVKNLSVLFLKDSGKYAFFDMAYPHVSDSHNYGVLESQLSETYYKDRFQAMIRH